MLFNVVESPQFKHNFPKHLATQVPRERVNHLLKRQIGAIIYLESNIQTKQLKMNTNTRLLSENVWETSTHPYILT